MDIQTIGRYQILSEIGRGGMSTVYKALDPNTGREVAIKILPQALLDNPTLRGRFQREAETVARLNHPNIVPVYDFGEHEGQPYLVMRLMRGGTLTERLTNGPLPLDKALPILQNIAAALDTAHRQGIIHRDLKPDNILFDQYNIPYLSDFGIVKLAESNATFTEGSIVGTPRYVSPEQAQGNQKLDGRSDIYSLGVILFEMLTGKRPFEGENQWDVLMQHINSPVPRISKLNPNLPATADTIISRALAKKPDQRYQTAAELVTDVTALKKQKKAKRGRQFPIWVWAAIGLLVILIGAGIWAATSGNLPGNLPIVFTGTNTASPTTAAPPTATSEPTTTITIAPTATTPPTIAPATETLPPAPTQEPSQTPTLAPTATPEPTATPTLAIISGSNANTLVESVNLSTDAPIYQLAVSPDSSLVALTTNGSVEIYTAADLALQHRWPLLVSPETRFSWSPDSTQLVIFEETGGVWVWERPNPTTPPLALIEQNSGILTLAWSPDNQWLAAGGRDELVHLWQRSNWSNTTTLAGHTQPIIQLAWSPTQQNVLASGSNDRTARLWNITAQSPLAAQEQQLFEMDASVQQLAWSPDGNFIALHGSGILMWWEIVSGGLQERRINITDFHWLLDGSHMALATGNNIEFRLLDGTLDYSLTGHTAVILQMQWLPTSPTQFLTVGQDKTIRVWDVTIQANILTIPAQEEQLSFVSWQPEGQGIVSVSGQRIRTWNPQTGEMTAEFPLHYDVRTVQWLSASSLLTLGGRDNLVRAWSLQNGLAVAALLPTHTDQANVRVIAWSPVTPHLAVLTDDEVVRIWDVAQQKIVQALFGHTIRGRQQGGVVPVLPVNDVVWSQDGRLLFTGGSDGTIRAWDATTGLEQFQLAAESPVRLLTLSNNGRFLAAIVSDAVDGQGQIQLWDVTTQEQVWQRSNSIIEVGEVAWSLDDARLAIGGWSGSGSQVRDAATGDSLGWLNLTDRQLTLNDLAWSPDNLRLFTAARDEGTIHLWNATVFGPGFSTFDKLIEDVHTRGIQNLLWLADGFSLATLSYGGDLRIWQPGSEGEIIETAVLPTDLAQGYAQGEFVYPGKRVYLALSATGQQLALVRDNQTVRILSSGE